MERDEFKILVKAMKAVYAQPTFIPDQDAFNVWYELLKDIPYRQAEIAIRKHMLTEKFPPTISDIRKEAIEITEEDKLDDLEAWSMVYKAICNSTYNSNMEYGRLPVIVQKAVGNPANLREWAMMDEKMISSVRARFIDSFKIVRNRAKEDLMLPDVIRVQIAKMKDEATALDQKDEMVAKIELSEKEDIEKKRCSPPLNLRERLRRAFGE